MAQVSRATWASALTTLINDNTAGDVTPADLRSILTDLEDSATWYDEFPTASEVAVVDSADLFVATDVEGVLAEMQGFADAVDSRLAIVEADYVTELGQSIYAFNAGGSSSATRPSVASGSIVFWYNTGGVKPTNFATNDIWQGIPGAETVEATTSRALALTDAGKTVLMNSGSAVDLDIPLNATVAFPTGTIINVIRQGAGAATITGVSGVTVNGTDGATVTISARWQGVSLLKVGADSWIASGALT